MSGLNLAQGDIITATAQYNDEKVSLKVKAVVSAAPDQTAASIISRNVTVADTMVIGKGGACY